MKKTKIKKSKIKEMVIEEVYKILQELNIPDLDSETIAEALEISILETANLEDEL
tara:strand:+ start:285 stop:449 length:165 start_codon:yes stop_codon:yes gene_type:complete